MMRRVFFILVLLIITGFFRTNAQTSRDPAPVPNSRDNGVTREFYNPYADEFNYAESGKKGKKKKRRKKNKKKKGYNFTYDQKIKEFEKRMKKAAKRYKKEARLARKPQYSNPLYFGHKKPPKKRPVGKRKLCKECGIVH